MNQIDATLARMDEDIRLRGYSRHTQDYYLRYARRFLEFTVRPANELGDTDIRAYLNHLLFERGLSKGTVNAHNGALRFLFEVTLDKAENHKQIPRLKQNLGLPEMLTNEELLRLFEHAASLNHKAKLMTVYGGGLRVLEACELRVKDNDCARMRIFVRNG